MKLSVSAFISGIIFSFGLIIAGMSNPAKVISFLDVSGKWDPSLAFVMIGAIVITAIGYKITLTREKPLFADSFQIPQKVVMDKQLILGAIIFGIGWGLAGICPGPALTLVSLAPKTALMFIIPMIIGLKLGGKVRV